MFYYVLDKPGEPGKPVGSAASKSSVDLQWTPAHDGGCPLEGYIVECKTKGKTKSETNKTEGVTCKTKVRHVRKKCQTNKTEGETNKTG